MAQVVPFTSAAKMHRERIMNLSWTPTTTATLLTSGANTQIKAYPYLRSLLLHVYLSATTGGGNFNATGDMPWSALSTILVTDTNGSGIYGGQNFTGFDAYAVNLLAGLRNTDDPTMDTRSYSGAAASAEFWLRIPFEYNQRTGAGSLPNMSANATYGLTLIGNTLGNIWQTAPTTTPTVNVDVWMENWTLPDAQDLLGRNQMQGPPLLGTTQYVTKQSYTGLVTNAGANTIALTRKGNMLRKWILVTRGGTTIEGHSPRIVATSAAGTAPTPGTTGALPNPFEFWWDGNRLSSDDPKFLLKKMIEEHGAFVQASSVASLPTGVCVYDFSAPYGINYGGDGEGGWLATTQSSRLEFVGSNWFGANDTTPSLDVITMDVAPIALANQYALDSASGKLLYPAQPEVRGG